MIMQFTINLELVFSFNLDSFYIRGGGTLEKLVFIKAD